MLVHLQVGSNDVLEDVLTDEKLEQETIEGDEQVEKIFVGMVEPSDWRVVQNAEKNREDVGISVMNFFVDVLPPIKH